MREKGVDEENQKKNDDVQACMRCEKDRKLVP